MSNLLNEIFGIKPEEDKLREQAGWGRVKFALYKEFVGAWQDLTQPVVDPEKVKKVRQDLISITRRALGVSAQRGTEMMVRSRQKPSEDDYIDADYRVVGEEK